MTGEPSEHRLNKEVQTSAVPNPLWIRFLKVAIYSAVILNAVYYVILDIQNYLLLPAAPSFIDWLQNFSTTIDYGAWLLMMGVFFVQTRWIDPARLGPRTGWLLGISILVGALGLCFALYLYVLEYDYYEQFVPFPSTQVCSQVEQGAYFLDRFQFYQLLTAENCEALSRKEVLVHSVDGSLISSENREGGSWLAVVNIINGVSWLVVVLFFQMRLVVEWKRPDLTALLRFMDTVKIVLYVILFGNATYWLFYGPWVDAWDAFLWLFAFLALELRGRPRPKAAFQAE